MKNRVLRMVGPVLFLALGGVLPGYAQSVSSDRHFPGMQVFIGGVLEVRSFMEQCPLEAFAPAVVEDDWDAATQRFSASLWASGMDAKLVRTLIGYFKSRIPDMDCAGTDPIRRYVEIVRESGWSLLLDRALEHLAIMPVEKPATPEQWLEVKALFEAERVAQARLLQCINALDPMQMLMTARDWENTVFKTVAMLVQAGVPRDELEAEAAKAQVSVLWTPVLDAADRQALAGSCNDDLEWQNRYFEYRAGQLSYLTEEILGLKP